MTLRRFSNERKRTRRPRQNRRKSKRKTISIKRKSILKSRNHRINTIPISFSKDTKFGYRHKEPRMMTKNQIENYMSNCVANPWRFFNDN